MAICVIVDGNNLAHYLYNLGPSRSIPLEIDAHMVEALASWAANQNREIEIELCLDPRREKVAGNKWVTVFTADPGRQADGMIVGKVSHRVYDGDLCWVVTSDEELQARVAEYQVRCISVRDFVLPLNTIPPSFAALPAKIPKGVLPPTFDLNQQSPKPLKKELRAPRRRRTKKPEDEYDRLIALTLAARNAPVDKQDSQGANAPSADQPADTSQELQTVQLTLSTWPLLPAIKFLKESFCPTHLPEVSGLFHGAQHLKPEDLPVLADFLLNHCAGETDFIRRGGCLMDRVRLALLQADYLQLPFQEIADLTGDSLADIRRKVRQNEGRWVKVELLRVNTEKEG